jgi:hypothetical protein
MAVQVIGNLLTLEFERYGRDRAKTFCIYAKHEEFFEIGIEAERRYESEEENGEMATEIRTQYVSILLKDEEIVELKDFLEYYLELKSGKKKGLK